MTGDEEMYDPEPMKQTFWKFLLPLELGARLLLLGGTEAIAESLSRQTGTVEHVQRFDPTSDPPLPFPDGAFDIVLFVDRGQLRRLRRGREARLAGELRRVAAADGAVAVVAENPNWPPSSRVFSWAFASPRSLAAALGRLGSPSQHWLLSPGDSNPRYIFSRERRRLSRAGHLTWRGRLRRRLSETVLWNWFATEFVLIANAGRRPMFLDRLLADLDRHTGARGAYIEGIQTGNPATCLLRVKFRTSPEAVIVRIPIDDHSRARCATNFRFFALAATYIPGQAPRPILHGQVDTQDYFAEEAIAGITVDEPKYPLTEIARVATVLLTKMHTASRHTAPGALAEFIADVAAQAHAKRVIDTRTRERFSAYCRKVLIEGAAPSVLFHGDFKIENLILARKHFAIRGLIDWDLARADGPAMVDLLFLLVYRRITATGATFERVYIDTLLADAWDADERALLANYAAALKIDPAHMLAYSALMWMHHFAFRMSHPDNPSLFAAGLGALMARIEVEAMRGDKT